MVENKFWSDFGFSVDINGKLLVSTENKLLKRDLGEGKGTALPLHMGDKSSFFLVLKISKPYMKLSKYTKLNKQLATSSVKSK